MQEFYFSGTIERVIFENASNFFRILLLEIDETDSDFEDYEIIVTGTMGDVMEGEDYTFWGQLTNHPKYGEQLQMTRYERSKPSVSQKTQNNQGIYVGKTILFHSPLNFFRKSSNCHAASTSCVPLRVRRSEVR